jgi:hypothetical protein
MRRIAAKFVLQLLSDDQKSRRLEVCEELKQRVEMEPHLMSRIITDDRNRGLRVWPGTKAPVFSDQPSSPRARDQMWKRRWLFSLTCRVLVQYDIAPAGQTVNRHYYREVLLRLGEKVRRQRPRLFKSCRWLSHHDNAPAHTVLSIQEFVAEKHFPWYPIHQSLHLVTFYPSPESKWSQKGEDLMALTP